MNFRTIAWPAAALFAAANLGMTLALIYVHNPWGKRVVEVGLVGSTAWPFVQLWVLRRLTPYGTEGQPAPRAWAPFVATHEAGESERLRGWRRNRETVLVVEDEEHVRAVVRMVLEAHGYGVIEASGGIEACRLAERYPAPIDLVITDVAMHPLSGPELADELARLRPGMKVLYVSGYPEQVAACWVPGLAAPAFLEKPFRPQDLLTEVRRVLDAPPAGGSEAAELEAPARQARRGQAQ